MIDLDQVFGSVALVLNQLDSLATNEGGGQGARPGKSVFREIAELKDENLTNPQVRTNAIFAYPFALFSSIATLRGTHGVRGLRFTVYSFGLLYLHMPSFRTGPPPRWRAHEPFFAFKALEHS